MMKIERCTVAKYKQFKHLCCVDTNVNFAGQFFCIEPNIAFVAYTRPFRNNGQRASIWPEHRTSNGQIDLTWLNSHVRTLARIMVAKEFRGQGIGQYLIEHTVDTIAVDYVECVTFTASIAHILEKCGFVNRGRTSMAGYDYFLRPRRFPVTFI